MAADFGIYGTNYPVIYDPGSSTSIYLEYAEIQKDEPEWDYVIHQSVKNGHRTIVRKGAHWVIEIIYHLYKTGTLTQQHAKADLLQNLKWNGTEFYYYRHTDGDAYRDANNAGVLFRLVEFKPIALEEVNYKDAVYLKIISTSYVKVVPIRTY